MTSTKMIEDLGNTLLQALQAKIDDDNYPTSAQSKFSEAHSIFEQRLSAFVEDPGHGDDSAHYDATHTSLVSAKTAVDDCKPDDEASIERARSYVLESGRFLDDVTRVQPKARFSGALSVRRVNPATSGSLSAGRQGAGGGTTVQDQTEPYLTSLAKLFPTEALSAFMLVLAIDPKYGTLRLVLIGVIAVFSGLLRHIATRDPETGKSDWLAVGVALASFLIYVAAMMGFGVLFYTDEQTTRLVSTVIAILWMAIIPEVVRKMPMK